MLTFLLGWLAGLATPALALLILVVVDDPPLHVQCTYCGKAWVARGWSANLRFHAHRMLRRPNHRDGNPEIPSADLDDMLEARGLDPADFH